MGLLQGITILDFSRHLPGPYATLRLAEMGARVLKIEDLTGDPGRFIGPKLNNQESIIYLAANTNKESIAIDLKTSKGKELIYALVQQVDIVIESFRPGIMEKLGLGYEKLKEYKSDIIYLSLTGYGETGEYKNFGGHDLNYLAISGVLSLLNGKRKELTIPWLTLADLLGGIAASEAVLAALWHREREKVGAKLDIAIVDQLIGLLGLQAFSKQKREVINKLNDFVEGHVCYQLYQTKDEEYVAFAPLEKKFWLNFLTAVGHLEWEEDQYALANQSEPIYNELVNLFKSKTLSEWRDFSQKVDCCLTPVNKLEDLFNEPYTITRNNFYYLNNEEQRIIQVFTNAARTFDNHKMRENQGYPPRIGEHTTNILHEFLKLTDREIVTLKEQKVIR